MSGPELFGDYCHLPRVERCVYLPTLALFLTYYSLRDGHSVCQWWFLLRWCCSVALLPDDGIRFVFEGIAADVAKETA